MITDKIRESFQLYIDKQMDKAQEAEFMKILTAMPEDELKELIGVMYDSLPETYIINEKSAQEICNNILGYNKAQINISNKTSYFRFNRFAGAAAVAIILITASLLFINQKGETPAQEINKIVEIKESVNKPLYKNDIKPGGNKAILTLADGSKVVLDDAKEGLLKEQGNTTIIKLDSGRVAYNIKSAISSIEKVVQYNTLTTPRGGKYCITLPDGTIVWLNASTTLRFPTAFNGKTRKVEVKGEAYFEVSKNENMPFIVLAGNSEIKVLGTHFNVMAYANEKLVKTTLLEGSVELKTLSKQVGDESIPVILTPGQQALVDESNTLSVKEVDTQEAIAWKNGLFIFRNESLTSVMQKIARWYDVEVIYENSNDTIQFTANISRSENVSEVLRMLELTETVHFKIEKKTITVLQ